MPGGSDQTLRPFLWRAERLYPDTEIVARTGRGIQRYDYGTYGERCARLAGALADAGIERGDRVGTFAWNTHRHFETYFGVPSMGAQLHTVNPLLPEAHVRYIVEDAADRVIFLDPETADALEAAYEPDAFGSVERFVVFDEAVPDIDLGPVTDYETFLDRGSSGFDWPDLDEEESAGLCYTSGTTGKPKGVEYTHQMLWAHTMATQAPQGLPLTDTDVVMPAVPMFHVNAWGLPYTATAGGAKHVFPGPSPDPADLAGLIEAEGVTYTAGVPTVWLGLFEHMRDHDVDLSSLERATVGGSAAPEAMIRRFDDHDVRLLHAWGMTETSPIGSVAHLKADLVDADPETRMDKRTTQGLTVPGLEFRVVDDDGNEVPWNGEDVGELQVRGPWVTTEYFARPGASESDFDDGYLRTGDVVRVDPDGYIEIVDRTKDVIKSGGEWISSVELENAIMAHEDVAEATVIGVPHERWRERPVAFVVPAADVDEAALKDDLVALVREDHPRWWAPDEVLFIDEIPKTATGKFDKKVLREEHADGALVEGKVPEEAAPEGE